VAAEDEERRRGSVGHCNCALSINAISQMATTKEHRDALPNCVFRLPCPLTTHPRPTTCNISSRHFIQAHTSFYLEFEYSRPIATIAITNRYHHSLPTNLLLINPIQCPLSPHPSSTSSYAHLSTSSSSPSTLSASASSSPASLFISGLLYAITTLRRRMKFGIWRREV
jgi:hypothetical protein